MTSFSSVMSGFHNDFDHGSNHNNHISSVILNGRKTLNVLQDNVLDNSSIENYCNSTTDSTKKQPKKSALKLGNNRMHNPAPVAVARRNARERNRVKQVNNGFATLQKHIPKMILSKYESNRSNSSGAAKKLSKVETLRMAVEYIRSLENILSSSGTSTTDSNMEDFSFTDDSLSLVSQLHEDSNSDSQFYEYPKQELLSPQPQPIQVSQQLQQQQTTLSLTLPISSLPVPSSGSESAIPSLVPLTSDESLLIENNFNFQNLINSPNEIILESDSVYESSFNNNNTNQNRNYVIMKTETDAQNTHQIVDCGGQNVIIWWQPNQDQQQQPQQQLEENQQQQEPEQQQQSLT